MLLPEGNYFIIGGAGFIGSHFTDALLASPKTRRVTIFDNFSSGRDWHYEAHRADPRLNVVHAGASDINALTVTMEGHDWVIHLASNADIAAAAECPEVDFYRGTLLTNNVVEAMRRAGLHRLLYASGSGVYGDAGDTPVPEDYAPLVPISTYGASKLACESLIASYCSMFGLHACAFRFGNVVGPRQTHGVGFDFVRSLSAKPKRLRILILIALYDLDENTLLIYNGLFWILYVAALATIERAGDRRHTPNPVPREILTASSQAQSPATDAAVGPAFADPAAQVVP